MRLGRYETLRPIASGGMATVHLGRALGAGGFERLVAIKVMHPHIAAEGEFVAMFLDEARLAARVRHPNVVPTIDVQEDPLFLVMEYVEGPSLHTVMRELKKRGERLPLEITLRVLLDTFTGLHAAHELTDGDGVSLDLVHRDVSPHNILIGADGVARITDFGVARAASRLSSTRGGQVKGKLAYMAPEQIASSSIDRRVDVYSAGVVLWETLTGESLFKADNDAALLATIIRGASKPPSSLDPSVPPTIDSVCMRALSLRTSARYATMAELADALEEAAHAAGKQPASSRALARFVKDLGAHEAASTASGSGRSLIPTATPSGRELFLPAPNSSPTSGPTPTHQTAATMAAPVPSEAMPVRPRRWPLAIGLAVGTLGLGGGLYVATREAPTAAPAAPASSTPAKATAQATAAATTALVTATAPPVASEASAAASSASPTVARTSRIQAPGGGGRPPATGFRPGGL